MLLRRLGSLFGRLFMLVGLLEEPLHFRIVSSDGLQMRIAFRVQLLDMLQMRLRLMLSFALVVLVSVLLFGGLLFNHDEEKASKRDVEVVDPNLDAERQQEEAKPPPPEEIKQPEIDAQLVVLTTHGRGGVDRWIRGSVAERVVSHGHLPVMLIRPWDHPVPEVTADHPGWRVLVPLDGTPLAEAPLAEAARLAVGGEVLLVRDVVPMHGEWSFDPSEQLEANAEAEAYLERVAERMRADGTRVRTVVLTRPEVVDAITEMVSMEAVDMIVVATHGRGAIGRWLHGSVSDDLALHAPVPVLLVHTAERVVAN